MPELEFRKLLESSIDSLFAVDHHLLRVDTSERSISHRLAMHLTSRFPNFDVGCEYNRAGLDVMYPEMHRLANETANAAPDKYSAKVGMVSSYSMKI